MNWQELIHQPWFRFVAGFLFGVVAFIVILAAVFFVATRESKPNKARRLEFERRLKAFHDELELLPLDRVKEQALAILRSEIIFEYEEEPVTDFQPVAPLGPLLHQFFSQFSIMFGCSMVYGCSLLTISRSDFKFTDSTPSYIRLGMVEEHVDLMTLPGEDTVREMIKLGRDYKQIGDDYPSIYHWILKISAEHDLRKQLMSLDN